MRSQPCSHYGLNPPCVSWKLPVSKAVREEFVLFYVIKWAVSWGNSNKKQKSRKGRFHDSAWWAIKKTNNKTHQAIQVTSWGAEKDTRELIKRGVMMHTGGTGPNHGTDARTKKQSWPLGKLQDQVKDVERVGHEQNVSLLAAVQIQEALIRSLGIFLMNSTYGSGPFSNHIQNGSSEFCFQRHLYN